MNLFRQWRHDSSKKTTHSEITNAQVEICYFDDDDNEQITLRVPISEYTQTLGATPIS
jgi:hypothetical protein